MKTLISLFFALSPFLTFGQGEEDLKLKRNVLKIAPQQFRVKSLKFGVEHFYKTSNNSLSLFITIRKEKNNQMGFPSGYDGLGGEFQYRKYLKPLQSYINRNNKNYVQGVYLAGYAQGHAFSGNRMYSFAQVDPMTGSFVTSNYLTHESIRNWGTGFTIGLQRVFWKIISLDLYIGGGIQWSHIILDGFIPPVFYSSPNNYYDPGFTGILPKFGAHIGIGL